jgi:hypothetical protein
VVVKDDVVFHGGEWLLAGLDVSAVLADEVCGVVDFEEVASGVIAVAYPIGVVLRCRAGRWDDEVEGELVHGGGEIAD